MFNQSKFVQITRLVFLYICLLSVVFPNTISPYRQTQTSVKKDQADTAKGLVDMTYLYGLSKEDPEENGFDVRGLREKTFVFVLPSFSFRYRYSRKLGSSATHSFIQERGPPSTS